MTVQQPPPPSPQPPVQQVLPKSPAVAVILSFFIPGLGSMVSGNSGTGLLILFLYVVSWILGFFLLFPFILAAGVWVWGMVNAHASAVAWNRIHGIIS